MIRNCKNCAGAVRYDIKSQKLVCNICSSSFAIGELGGSCTNSSEMECDVYVCDSCGADIIINGTESSTFCPYCGNATVVLSRVAKMKRPEVIIPFEITPEVAIKNIKEKFSNGFFIPDIINPTISDMRGIYVPYYVTNVEFNGNIFLVGKSGKDKNNGYSRGGYCSANWVTTDASKRFSDSFSERLEPYYFDNYRDFDEEYLLGFYSDIADVDEEEAVSTARKRVIDYAREKMVNSVTEVRYFMDYYTLQTNFQAEVYEQPVTAMLPVWFYTYTYNGNVYTIAVNGQTGQVSGGIPWNGKKFAGLVVLFTALVGAMFSLPVLFMATETLIMLLAGFFPLLAVIVLIVSKNLQNFGGYKKFFASISSKNVAKSNSLITYVNKREGGQ